MRWWVDMNAPCSKWIKYWLPSYEFGVSLEAWHDDIHVLVGSALTSPARGEGKNLASYPGHMSSVGVAAVSLSTLTSDFQTDDSSSIPFFGSTTTT